VVMAISKFFVPMVVGDLRRHWRRYLFLAAGVEAFAQGCKMFMDRVMLKLPILAQ